jgi:D-3-phosphoglycerate dehydrogenase
VEDVNIVNAEVLLRERGIELVELQRQDKGAFSSVISAQVTTDTETHRAAGTLFGHKLPRLVQIDDHKLEAYLDGVLLVFTHTDVPGIIGRVGTIFGKHNVNIAQMAVGRSTPGGAATGVLNIDGEPPAAALKEVRNSPDIKSANVIKLPPAGKLPTWLQG